MPQVGEVYRMAYDDADPDPFFFVIVKDVPNGWLMLTLYDDWDEADGETFFADLEFFESPNCSRFA